MSSRPCAAASQYGWVSASTVGRSARGRAGRRGRGLAVYVAGEDALDQFFCREPEEFLDLESIDLLWPVPAKGFQGFDDRKTSGFDPAADNAVLPCGYFALDEAAGLVGYGRIANIDTDVCAADYGTVV